MDRHEDPNLDPRLEALLEKSNKVFSQTRDFGDLTPEEIDMLKNELGSLAIESGHLANEFRARNTQRYAPAKPGPGNEEKRPS